MNIINKSLSILLPLVVKAFVIGFYGSIIYVLTHHTLITGLILLGVGTVYGVGVLIYAKFCSGNGCASGVMMVPGISMIMLGIPVVIIGLI